MTDRYDPLREAFSLLASASSADAKPNPELEERLMSMATTRSRLSGRRATLKIVVCVCLLAGIGGTTVVAAGGIEGIRNWFATAEVIHPDGTKEELEVTPDGEVSVGENYSYKVSPDQLDDLEGRKVIIFRAPQQPNE